MEWVIEVTNGAPLRESSYAFSFIQVTSPIIIRVDNKFKVLTMCVE